MAPPDHPVHSVAALPVSAAGLGVDRPACARIAAGPAAMAVLDRFARASSTPRQDIRQAFAVRFGFADMLVYVLSSGRRAVQGILNRDTVRSWEAVRETGLVHAVIVRYRGRISSSSGKSFPVTLSLWADGRVGFFGESPKDVAFKAGETYSFEFEPVPHEELEAALA